MTIATKPPVWFWIIAIVAILWNLMGCAAYVMEMMMTPEQLAALPQEQQDLYAARPSWVTSAFAIAVFAGLVGSIALALRKSVAMPLFALSLIAVLVQNYWSFGVAKVHEVMGTNIVIFPLIVVVVAILLLWVARTAKAKGWTS
ncbi:MAG: hypothetical protein R3E02_15860 [Blastomonas sp.]